ncbi:bifunctional UDP-sugar hydrolase/5'-nucleotidase [Actinomyces sp.]|uniref:bifunctional metallophosphatase/5'-nucleotidase n=1 Tax=Actinomyces sp. TaxID=29317 RepID=UPI0026DB4874|nr:bifunctional UDP-sugar hydrolase/5'-nucleotidase [Actinomyces sp.]MDO4901483.1 bifunctional UDP-sugar hydrolase/5'-nucleotidase [Actinomyces sp.]
MRPRQLVRAAVSVTAIALAVLTPAAASPIAVAGSSVGGPVVVAAPLEGMLAGSGGADAVAAPVTINLLGISDFAGHIERVSSQSEGAQFVTDPGAITLACEVAAVRAAQPDTLLVSTGDNVGGSAYISSVLEDQPTIDILGAIDLDVTAAGNHEFDRGAKDLATRLLGALDAPVLAANVTGNDALSAEGDGDGVWTTEVDGATVGFVGLTTDSLPSLVTESALEGLEVTDLVETANARAAALKDGDAANGEADVVIVLAHEDAEVYAGRFNGSVDAVFGGHTHAAHASAITGRDGNPIAVVQPGQFGELLGNITLSLNPATGAVDVVKAENIDLTDSDCTADAYGVQEIVARASRDSEAAGARILTSLDTGFYRGTNDGTDPGTNRSTESTAANVIADSYRAWLNTEIQPDGEHRIGLMNPGGVRADYLPGDLTEGDAYTVQPFGNEMGYAAYTGAQLRAVLAQQWRPDTSRPTLMLGVSANVQVYIDQDAADELEEYWRRISTGEQTSADLAEGIDAARGRVIHSVYVDGVELTDDAEVVVASNSFMLAGGDGFTVLTEGSAALTGVLDRAVTAEYFQAGGAASADLAKRQMGVDLKTDATGGDATVRFTGLSFTTVSEQAGAGAAQEVTATVALADGGTQQLTSAAVDTTITPELPETGTSTLNIALPDDVATTACPMQSQSEDGVSVAATCAVVSFTLVARDGSTRSVDFQAFVPHRAANHLADTGAPAAGDQVITAPAEETPVRAGFADVFGSFGAMAAAVVAAGGVAGYSVIRRGLRQDDAVRSDM